jgi:trans-aconitate methyltransferase
MPSKTPSQDAKPDFSRRTAPRDLPELMDGDCSYPEFRDCLLSLEQVNRWLFGYRPTLAWLDRLPQNHPAPLHILDVGCGGGDLLRKISIWARRRRIAVQLTGIDMNPYATRAASEFTPQGADITWVTGDALAYRPQRPIEIVVSSLMTHHLEDHEIIAFLRWMESNAQTGWFINDLERSKPAHDGFRLLAKIARWHPFVRHDGPVSFRRALSTADWIRLLAAANIPLPSVTIEKWRPGRLSVGRWKERIYQTKDARSITESDTAMTQTTG